MIHEIGKHIANNIPFFVCGETLQIGFTAQYAPVRHTVILNSVGASTSVHLPDQVEPIIQFISRSEDHLQAYNDSMLLFSLFHGATSIELPVENEKQYIVTLAQAVSTPFNIGFDGKKHEYSLNIKFDLKEKEE